MTIASETSELKPLRVLSLSGGGIRGIYAAAFLDGLVMQYEARTSTSNLDLGRGFDLICGTSTGAIVACAVAMGFPLSRVVDLYQTKGKTIFPHRIKGKLSIFWRMLNRRRYVKKGDQALRDALTEVFGNTTFLDVFTTRRISLAIPAISMSTYQPWVFKKTPQSGARDDAYRLVDACMASSAAPIYRSLSELKVPNSNYLSQTTFVDGGLWANNPVMVAMIDALQMAKKNQPIQIFSVGTCPAPSGENISGDSVHRSLLDWRMGAKVIPLAITAQEHGFEHMSRLISNHFSSLGQNVQTITFPHRDVPADMTEYLSLDDTRAHAMNWLVSKANQDVNQTLSACDDSNNHGGHIIRSMLEDLKPSKPTHVLHKYSDPQQHHEL